MAKNPTDTPPTEMSDPVSRPRIGLALGGGGARGWSHIGVIRGLKELGIEPDIVCGTSIGALVGGAYVTDGLDDLAEWLEGLRWRDVVGFFDVSFGSGFISGKRLFNFFRERLPDVNIEDVPTPFAAVATRLDNGHEVWLRKGSIMHAMRASIAVPGFFTPVYHEGRWLVDGGLANPVPISVCRVLGADLVIAVALYAHRHRPPAPPEKGRDLLSSVSLGLVDKLKGMLQESGAGESPERPQAPSLFDVVTESIEIMQLRIMRSRMAGDPPDVLVLPRTDDIKFLEFHRATKGMEAGYRAVMYRKTELEELKAMLVS